MEKSTLLAIIGALCIGFILITFWIGLALVIDGNSMKESRCAAELEHYANDCYCPSEARMIISVPNCFTFEGNGSICRMGNETEIMTLDKEDD